MLAISAKRGEGLGALDAYLAPAQTVALIGSSGVGKSTMVNRLLGQELSENREHSARRTEGAPYDDGSRHLVELPGGALLIDTPGMRELQPWVDESAVADTFEDIAELAPDAVSAIVRTRPSPAARYSRLSRRRARPERLEHFRHLGREIAFEERKRDKAAAAAQKKQWKKIHQAAKQLYKERDRGLTFLFPDFFSPTILSSRVKGRRRNAWRRQKARSSLNSCMKLNSDISVPYSQWLLPDRQILTNRPRRLASRF